MSTFLFYTKNLSAMLQLLFLISFFLKWSEKIYFRSDWYPYLQKWKIAKTTFYQEISPWKVHKNIVKAMTNIWKVRI